MILVVPDIVRECPGLVDGHLLEEIILARSPYLAPVVEVGDEVG